MTAKSVKTDAAALIAAGQKVIRTEAAALSALADTLGTAFAASIEIILAAEGRIIVSGIGKSGHIARKIAATFASTGTPSIFVHPAEASHGDLGMITGHDIVILLSNSGETSELSDLIEYTRRFSIPLIGVASRPDSTLIRRSDIGLVLPPEPEASTSGLAPTTSTTMTLALGDALAIAIMEHRQFSPEDFRRFHPGGRLGARLATVANLMHESDQIPLVASGTPMSEALLVMSQKSFGVVGIQNENGALAGIITDGDLRRNMDGLLNRTVDDVMTANPTTVAATALASEALGIMNSLKITTLFAMDPDAGGQPVGILHIHDCLRAGVT